MIAHSTLSYWTRRERDERALAERTGDVAARRIHLLMAGRYRRRIEQVGA